MKILLYGINYAPEPTGIGKYTGEMAEWLAKKGHRVRVIAAPPYYPHWKRDDGHGAFSYSTEQRAGCEVLRAPLWVPANPGGFKRIVHLASFALTSLPWLVRSLGWRPDVVLVVAPAFMCAPAGWLLASVCRAQSWLHVQDFEVDAAFDMGLLKGGVARRVVTAIERWVFRRFDRVSSISDRMLDKLRAKGVDPERVVSFPNWVDVNAMSAHSGPGKYRAELGIATDAVVALYSGSMAGKQGLEILPAAARLAPGVTFIFCGQGAMRPQIEAQCAGLPNVRLLPLQPAERLPELLATADIHLLPQQAAAADLVMPSKLTGMLCSGRPTVATARAGTELARVVAGRGLVVPPEALDEFVAAITRLAAEPELRRELGIAARAYAECHLARDRVLRDFELQLMRSTVVRPKPVALDVGDVSTHIGDTK